MRFLNPIRIVRHLIRHSHLIRQMTAREVRSRYKGTFLGTFWAFIQPLLLLGVYTFVFSVIFQAKWGSAPADSKLGFALALFTGMLTFNILGETLNASPMLILMHENYVKKVIFPLEILPVVKLLGTVMHQVFGLGILFIGIMVGGRAIPWTIIMLPLVWGAIALFALGWSYFLASLGVFVRDVQASVGLIVTVLFFMSPIFYPLEAVPADLRPLVMLNPIAIFVEDARRVVLWGQPPDWLPYSITLTVSVSLFVAGFIWFMKSKRAFADVM